MRWCGLKEREVIPSVGGSLISNSMCSEGGGVIIEISLYFHIVQLNTNYYYYYSFTFWLQVCP